MKLTAENCQKLLKTPKQRVAANLEYLFKEYGRGGKTKLALHLRVSESTVSRWGSWEEGRNVTVPHKARHPDILSFFGYDPNIDLADELIFINSNIGKDEWIRKINDELNNHNFNFSIIYSFCQMIRHKRIV